MKDSIDVAETLQMMSTTEPFSIGTIWLRDIPVGIMDNNAGDEMGGNSLK